MSRSNWFSSRRAPASRRTNRRRKLTAVPKLRKSRQLQLECLEARQVLSATVATDLPDYLPGATAHILASEFAVGETVKFQVLHTDGIPNTGGGHEPWLVTDGVMGDFDGDGVMDGDLDGVADGNIHTTWYVNPDDSNGSSFELSALGLSSGSIATTTFTDLGSNLSQFANKPTTSYQNGSLNGSNSAYSEGHSIPFRYLVSDARENAWIVLDIIYQFQQSAPGPRTYDFLTSDTASQAITDTDRFGPDSSSKPSGFGLTSSTNLIAPSIPDDASITTDTGGNFRVASNVPVSIVSVSTPTISSSPDEKHIVLVIQLGNDGDATLNENIVDVGVFWGGHLARDTDYAGNDNGASDASGSSFHMRAEGFLDLNANGTKDNGESDLGGGDRSINTQAIVHTSLAWEKRRADTNALLGGATFTVAVNPFTGSGSLTVVDDTDGVTSAGDIDRDPDPGQFLLEEILFGTYTITETAAPAGFALDSDSTRVQSVTSSSPTAVVGVQGQNDAGTNDESDFHNPVAANPVINIVKLVNGQDANSTTGPMLAAGSTATFTYTVTNGGNVALSNVSVVDDNGTPGSAGDDFSPTFTGGDTNSNGLLDLTETWTFSATRTVIAGQYTNIATASGKSLGNTTVTKADPANYFGSAPALNIETFINGQDADAATGPVLSAGGTATFTYQVTNTGNIAVGSIVVVDDNGTSGNAADDFNPTFTGGDTNSNGLLDLGETWNYSATRTVVSGQYTNIGKVTGSVAVTAQSVSDTDPANYFGSSPALNIEKLINGQDADAATGPVLAAGGTATFTYQVTNTGNIAVGSIAVVDDNGTPGNVADDFGPTFAGGDTNSNGLLDLGETWNYSASRTVVAGQYTNIGKVSGSVAATGQSVNDTDPANYFGAAPALNIEKLVNGQDADSATGPILAAGGTATFTYQLTNTGNIAVGSIVVVDDNGTPGNAADDFNPAFTGGDANSNGLLNLGETWTYSASAAVVAGQYTNIGSVSGSVAATGQTASDTDPANYFGAVPGIDIEKLVDGQDADSATGPILPIGGAFNFTYNVTNTGNIALDNVVVVDDNGTPANLADDFNPTFTGGDSNSNGLLDLGETWTYSAASIVTAGQYTNVGTASGQVADTGQAASDTDPANYFGAAPAIDIEKLVNGVDSIPTLSVGGTVLFNYTVKNTGNIALSNVVVVDDNGTPGNVSDDFNATFTGGDTNSNGLLDLGETWTFIGSSSVLAGPYTNVATATGTVAATGQTANDSDTSGYFGAAPGIDVEKLISGDDADTAPGPTLHVGDSVTFTYIVKNTGNIALANVAIVDDNGTPGNLGDDFSATFIGGDANGNSLLDLGETWTFTATQTVVAGQYTNVGRVTGAVTATGQTATDSDAANYFGKVDPIIVIAPDKGNTSKPIVKVVNPETGKIVSQFYAYEGKFLGGVQVATGDLTGDGIDEIITAPGQGRVGEVRVFTQQGVELTQFRVQPYGSAYTGGIEVEVGDVNGDGKNDIVTVTKYGRPDVRVFYNYYNTANPSADAISDTLSKQFYVFASNFRGGADVIVADMGKFHNGTTYDAYTPDGKSEIIVASGSGMRATVYVYDLSAAPKVVDTILPFANSFKGGVTLSAARVNGDAIPDLILAAGNGGGPAVEIYSGLTNDATDVRLAAFSTFGDQSTKNMPVHAAAIDTTGDGIADILAVVQGTNGKSNQIRYFNMSGALQGTHYGFPGPWNIASLNNVDPSLPLNTKYDVAAKDDVYTLIGATSTAKKPAKKKK